MDQRLHKIQETIRLSIQSIQKLQSRDSSFISLSSQREDFKHYTKKETVFPTSLITFSLATLDTIADVNLITKKSSNFLSRQKSSQCSWNYVTRNSKTSKTMMYPDDMDDTSCALIALKEINPSCIDGKTLSQYVEHLIYTEEKIGGPYNTWITKNKGTNWKDIDLGVNANIACFLAKHDIHLKNLSQYIDTHVSTLSFNSKYYHSPFSIIYFISRYYTHCKKINIIQKHKKLILYLTKKIKNRNLNTLDISLIVISLYNLGGEKYIPQNTLQRILKAQNKNALWDAHPFYIEEIKNNTTYYCGSPILTTAFVLEALGCMYKEKTTKQNNEKNTLAEELFNAFSKTLPIHMRKDLHLLYTKIILKDPQKSIELLLFYFNHSLKSRKNISKETLAYLGLANVLGWIGYTIQDDILDENKNKHLLPLSNICIRKAHEILVHESGQKQIIDKVFDLMDSANAWENTNMRLTKDFKMPALNVHTLAHKSFGHALGPLIILIRNGLNPSSKEYKIFKKFFTHYLIARQLNDDAHDWENDLRVGILNKISLSLIAYTPQKNIPITEKVIIRLKKQFWEKEIENTCAEIKKHITCARTIISNSKIISDKTLFNEMITPLENSIEKALSERNKTLTFLKHYKNC